MRNKYLCSLLLHPQPVCFSNLEIRATLISQPGTQHPKPETRNPKPKPRKPKTQIRFGWKPESGGGSTFTPPTMSPPAGLFFRAVKSHNLVSGSGCEENLITRLGLVSQPVHFFSSLFLLSLQVRSNRFHWREAGVVRAHHPHGPPLPASKPHIC